MLLIDCPHCSRRSHVDGQAGMILECAFCRGQMVIEPPLPPPQIINIHTSPPPRKESSGEVHKRAFAASSGSTLGVVYVLGGVAVLLISLCSGITCFSHIREDMREQGALTERQAIAARAKSVLARYGVKGELSSDTRVVPTLDRWGVSHTVSGSIMQHGAVSHFIVDFEITDFRGKRVFVTKLVAVDNEVLFSE